MSIDGHVPLPPFRFLERTAPSVPKLEQLDPEIDRALSALQLPREKLFGRRIAVSAGSRGIADLRNIARAVCGWLKSQGAHPFVFPGMGSHGGATAEGQRKVLEEYGVISDYLGAEVRSSMESVCVGVTPEGFTAYMDRNAWEADAVVVMNRVKPHTDFSGKIESGVLKMMAVGMGKVEGAREVHRWGRKFGNEKVIRALSAKVLASGKILCGLAVIENEDHELCSVRAARPEGIVAQEEEALEFARRLVPRIPFPELHLLIVDEMGKNISGAGMDTKTIGRGVALQPLDGPQIQMIYVRDLTPQSEGNACGIGLADVIHERVFRKIDLQKTYVNCRVSLNPRMAHLPIYLPTDREALDLALGALGRPAAAEQCIAWIRNTLNLDRLAISEALASEASALTGWHLTSETCLPQFDSAGNLAALF